MRGLQSYCWTYVGLPLMLFVNTAMSATGPTSVVVSGRQLLVNGQPFLIKGVGYSPIPIGRDTVGCGDVNDYFTTEHRGIYIRDLPILRAMGTNTIRLWGWCNEQDHTEFLDLAWNGGVDPIYVIVSFWIDEGVITRAELGEPSARSRVAGQFCSMIEKVKDHPAVLMWCIGNELNSEWKYGVDPNFAVLDPNLFTLIDELAEAAHSSEGPNYHPVTTPLMDLVLVPTIGGYDPSVPHLDLWGANVYRGSSFGTLFMDYASVTTKPLVILEYGIDSYDSLTCQEDETAQADFAEDLWHEIKSNASQSDSNRVCIGGSIMEYSDEWWKVKDYTTAPPNCSLPCEGWNAWGQSVCGTPREANAFPDAFSNEEWYGIVRPERASGANLPDVMQPKEAYRRLQECWGPQCRTLRLNIVNGSWGDVTLAPMPGGWCPDTPGPNEYRYAESTIVTLTAVPIQGKSFRHWEIYNPNYPDDANHAIIDSNTVLTVVMDSNRSIGAVFKCGSNVCPLSPMLVVGLLTLCVLRRRW